jgi:hypothetical protein
MKRIHGLTRQQTTARQVTLPLLAGSAHASGAPAGVVMRSSPVDVSLADGSGASQGDDVGRPSVEPTGGRGGIGGEV